MNHKKKIGKSRKTIGYILLGLCIAFIVYFAVVMAYRLATVNAEKRFSVFTRFFAEFGIMCLLSLPALDICFNIFRWVKNRALKITGIIFRVVSIIILFIFISLGTAIIITGEMEDEKPVKNVCLLGLSIDSDELPQDLIYRLDKALEYNSEHTDVPFIATGGNSDDPYYSEAEQMIRYLEENGFDTSAGNVIAETNARSTVENFKYTASFVNKEDSLGVITNNHHMFRATGIAKKQGYTSLVKIPAKSSPVFYLENVMWESICSFFLILSCNMAF